MKPKPRCRPDLLRRAGAAGRGLRHCFPAACLALLLVSCVPPGSVKRTVKIGLSAPFEGLYRDLGYEVLHAVRLAVREQNEAGGVGGRYLVELVALNDWNEGEEAALKAREMAADPGVLGVLGGWSPVTERAATGEYDRLGLAFLAPEWSWGKLAAAAARFSALDLTVRRATLVHAPDPGYAELVREAAAALLLHSVPAAVREARSGEEVVGGLGLGEGSAADLLFIAAEAPEAAEWAVAARRAGFRGTIVGGPSFGTSVLLDLGGEAVEGAYFVSPFAPVAVDSAFADAYRLLSGGHAPGPIAAWAYRAATHLLDTLELAARDQGRPTRAGVLAALAERPAEKPGSTLYVIRDGSIGLVEQ